MCWLTALSLRSRFSAGAAATNELQVIDFDAATADGEPVGAKTSSAVCPPEMVAMLNGRPVLLALENPAVDRADVLRAHRSFDSWSYGVVGYELLAGQPLIPGVDAQENLDGAGLEALAGWDDFSLERRLERIADATSRDFLRALLQPAPEDRAAFGAVLAHAMLNPAAPEELAAENERLQRELEAAKTRGDADGGAAIMAQMQLMAAQVASGFADVQRDVQTGFAGVDEKLTAVASSIEQMSAALERNQRATCAMLAALLTGEHSCPRFVVVLPAQPPAGWGRKMLKWSKMKNWVNKTVTVHFVCPVTLECAGAGYELTLPKDWVTKYGPALQVSPICRAGARRFPPVLS